MACCPLQGGLEGTRVLLRCDIWRGIQEFRALRLGRVLWLLLLLLCLCVN